MMFLIEICRILSGKSLKYVGIDRQFIGISQLPTRVFDSSTGQQGPVHQVHISHTVGGGRCLKMVYPKIGWVIIEVIISYHHLNSFKQFSLLITMWSFRDIPDFQTY
jgi:hypothetical protein